MLLQPNTPNLTLNFHNNHQNPLSFSYGFSQSHATNYNTHKTYPVSITCSSSISQVHSYGTVDFESKPIPKWNDIYKKISMLDDPNMGSASVLNQVENEGKKLSKWELSRVVKELRKFRRFKLALEVYEWMNSTPERYKITASDAAIQLDLIAKANGISSAEQYFQELPDALKEKRTYGSLLNSYVRAKMKEEAESLMDEMRNNGFANHSLPYNVMMTLYMNLKLHEKIVSLVAEMKEKNIGLDLYSYNIWLSSCDSLLKMEEVFEQMKLDNSTNPNWTTFSSMATMYTKFEQFEKAEECLKMVESRITGRDRMPYHYLISIYANIGKKEEIFRVWNIYKGVFMNIPNLGYHTIISALVRVNDVEGAEKMYAEWLSVKSIYDPRVGNLILGSYVRNGLSKKAEVFFEQMIDWGGKPNSVTWEILAEDRLKKGNVPDALSLMQKAASEEGSKKWKPKPKIVASILDYFEKEGDVASTDALVEVLKEVGCLDDAVYMSLFPVLGGETFTRNVTVLDDRVDSDGEGETGVLGELQETL